MTLRERFDTKVERTDGCWLWTGGRKQNGYGVIGRGGKAGGTAYAHRIAWELEHGPIPDGMFVCHHCDNRRCVRPDHLFLGTAADNAADMAAKGRSLHGERHNRVILGEADVLEIRRLWAAGGMTQAEIGARFGVLKGHVSMIVRGTTWQRLLPEGWEPPAPRKWSRAA